MQLSKFGPLFLSGDMCHPAEQSVRPVKLQRAETTASETERKTSEYQNMRHVVIAGPEKCIVSRGFRYDDKELFLLVPKSLNHASSKFRDWVVSHSSCTAGFVPSDSPNPGLTSYLLRRIGSNLCQFMWLQLHQAHLFRGTERYICMPTTLQGS
jgi:hypothetical protein